MPAGTIGSQSLLLSSLPWGTHPCVFQSVPVNTSHSCYAQQTQPLTLYPLSPPHQSSQNACEPAHLSPLRESNKNLLNEILWKLFLYWIQSSKYLKSFYSSFTLCSTAFASAFCISALSRFSMSEDELLVEAIVMSRWCNSRVSCEISIFIPSNAEL